jgi:hypothetical protein
VQEETKVFGGITVPVGSVVVKAQIYNSIPHNPGWFEPPKWDPSMAYHLVWIQHVVRAVVPSKTSKQVGEHQLYPAKPANISAYNKEATSAFPLRKVAASMVASIKEEIMLRDELELEVVEKELIGEQHEFEQQHNNKEIANNAAQSRNPSSFDSHSKNNCNNDGDMSDASDDEYKPH